MTKNKAGYEVTLILPAAVEGLGFGVFASLMVFGAQKNPKPYPKGPKDLIINHILGLWVRIVVL